MKPNQTPEARAKMSAKARARFDRAPDKHPFSKCDKRAQALAGWETRLGKMTPEFRASYRYFCDTKRMKSADALRMAEQEVGR